MLYLQMTESWERLRKHVDDEDRIQTDYYKLKEWQKIKSSLLR